MERRSAYSYCLIALVFLMLPVGADLIGGSKTVNINKLRPKGADTYVLTMNGTTTQWLPAASAGSGDVVGPASATDNAIARFDTTTGKLLQNTASTIDNSGILSTAGALLSGLTASEMLITDASKNLASAAVATYPSLTELTYVKGVTSAIQTQINTKISGNESITLSGDVTGSGTTAITATVGDDSHAHTNSTITLASTDLSDTTSLVYVTGDTMTGDLTFNDSVNATFGTGGDADIDYDGTDLVINPKVVGSGVVDIAGGLKIDETAYFDAENDDGTCTTTDTIDWSIGNHHKSTLGGTCTYTFTAPAGPTTITLKIVQDGTGSRTTTFPASVKWSGGTAPTLSTAAASVDIVSFYYDGSVFYGASALDFQ
jgi:hypothetical protein